MAKLAVVENGKVKNVIVGEPEDFPDYHDVTGQPVEIGYALEADGSFSPPPPPPKEWSTLEFVRQFTRKERIDIRAASKSDTTVEDFMDLIDKASVVRSDDASTTDGLDYLVNKGIITQSRRDEILAP